MFQFLMGSKFFIKEYLRYSSTWAVDRFNLRGGLVESVPSLRIGNWIDLITVSRCTKLRIKPILVRIDIKPGGPSQYIPVLRLNISWCSLLIFRWPLLLCQKLKIASNRLLAGKISYKETFTLEHEFERLKIWFTLLKLEKSYFGI